MPSSKTREERLAALDAELAAMRAAARAKIDAKRAKKKAQSQHRCYIKRQRRKREAERQAVRDKWFVDRRRGLIRRTEQALRERLKPYAKTFATTTDNLKMIFERLPRVVVGMLIEKQLLTEDQRERAIASAQRALPTFGVKPVPARKQIRK